MVHLKCQIPMCNKKPTKEVHIYEKANLVEIIFFCERHFEEEENWLRIKKIRREIFDLKPKVDNGVKVQFT